MAEKTTPKKRSSRKAMVELVAETEKEVAERKEAETKPEERIAAKAVREAVAVADALSSEDVVRSIGEMKSTIARTLAQLADRPGRGNRQVQPDSPRDCRQGRRIAGDLRNPAIGLDAVLAIMETQQRQQEEMQREFQSKKEQLEREIEATRGRVGKERNSASKRSRSATPPNRNAASGNRKNTSTTSPANSKLRGTSGRPCWPKAKRSCRSGRRNWSGEWAEREKALAAGEEETEPASSRAAGFAAELKAAAEGAATEATARLDQQHRGAEESAGPPGGRREERAGGENRGLGTDRQRPGGAARAAGAAGGKSLRASPGNRRPCHRGLGQHQATRASSATSGRPGPQGQSRAVESHAWRPRIQREGTGQSAICRICAAARRESLQPNAFVHFGRDAR